VRIFLSHASEQTEITESIAIALSGERHIVSLIAQHYRLARHITTVF
jgi:hypothetical protein